MSYGWVAETMLMVSKFLDQRGALLAIGSTILFLEGLAFALIMVNTKTIPFTIILNVL
jgi:hypothetical protein